MNTFISLAAALYVNFFAFSRFALAQAPKLIQPAPGSGATLQDFIALLIEIMQAVGIPFLVICIIYSGYILLTAGGNEEQITRGKLWIFWTLVGAAIILSAQVIANLVYGTANLF